jgi:hypothetical protein
VAAEHLDYTWARKTRSGRPRLVLLQDLAAHRREEALRKGPEHDVAVIRGYLEARLRLAAGPEVRALSRLSHEQRIRRLEELDERLYGRIVRESRTSPNGRVFRFSESPQAWRVTSRSGDR